MDASSDIDGSFVGSAIPIRPLAARPAVRRLIAIASDSHYHPASALVGTSYDL